MSDVPMRGEPAGARVWRVGPLRLPVYSVMLYLGCVIGVLAGAAYAASTGLSPRTFCLLTIALLVPAFVGARLWFVAQHLGAFRGDPASVARRQQGGAALFGGLVVGVACSVPVLALARVPFLRFWDAASITMLVGLVVTRFGCLLNGCCAGRATSGRFGMRLPDVEGRWRRRFPTQLLEAAVGMLILGGVVAVGGSAAGRPGALFAGVVGAYGVARFVLEPTRATASPVRERGVNMAFAALLAIGSAALLVATLL